MTETTEELIEEYKELMATKAGPSPHMFDMERFLVVDEELHARMPPDELLELRKEFLFLLSPEGQQDRNQGEG